LPAGAAGASTSRIAVGPASASTKAPNSNIVGAGSKGTFHPDSLSVKVDSSTKECQDSFVSFTVTNTSSKEAYVEIDGSPFPLKMDPPVYLPAGQVATFCASGGSKGETAKLLLVNKAGTKGYGSMTVTLKN
jgi:hypothetical protein